MEAQEYSLGLFLLDELLKIFPDQKEEILEQKMKFIDQMDDFGFHALQTMLEGIEAGTGCDPIIHSICCRILLVSIPGEEDDSTLLACRRLREIGETSIPIANIVEHQFCLVEMMTQLLIRLLVCNQVKFLILQ